MIKVFLADIRALRSQYERCLSVLTPKRREKTEFYRCEDDQLRSAAAGLLMKTVLGVAQDDLIAYNQFGKPYIKQSKKCFSLSHGGNYTVIAVMDSNVGIDVEPIGQVDMNVANRVFLPDELAWMAEEEQEMRFFMLWAQKESVMKAEGGGFNIPPDSFSVLTDCGWVTKCFIYDDHVIACAARSSFKIEYEVLPIQILLPSNLRTIMIDLSGKKFYG